MRTENRQTAREKQSSKGCCRAAGVPFHSSDPLFLKETPKTSSTHQSRVFDETLFRIFAKHKNRENAPVFRETFTSFANSNFRDFRVSQKL